MLFYRTKGGASCVVPQKKWLAPFWLAAAPFWQRDPQKKWLAPFSAAPFSAAPFSARFLGTNHTCAVLTDGGTKCWGRNSFGALGLGVIDNDHRGDAPGEMSSNLPAGNLGTGLSSKAIAVGRNHSCVLLSNGDGGMGQVLGNGMVRSARSRFVEGLWGQLRRNGKRASFRLSWPEHDRQDNPRRANTTCVIFDNGRLKCWGSNSYGKLGLGDNFPRGDEQGEMGSFLPHVPL
jgi:alpha-tubulin suppressor-like RCC1 family protein